MGFLSEASGRFLVKLARTSIEKFLTGEEKISVPDDAPREVLNVKAGVFVTLTKKANGALRGCIGTVIPTEDNVALETIKNSISAATRDPRFSPVSADELPEIKVSVSVLSPLEPVTKIEELDPKKYGVLVVSRDGRTGVLLPNIEGVNTVEEQLFIAMRKGGIRPGEPISVFRFTTEKYEEEGKAS